MIKLCKVQDRHFPRIVCDACGEIISDATRGIFFVIWSERGEAERLLHLCQGDCHDLAEETHGKERTGWLHLNQHLAQLVFNLGMKSPDDYADWQKRARIMEGVLD